MGLVKVPLAGLYTQYIYGYSGGRLARSTVWPLLAVKVLMQKSFPPIAAAKLAQLVRSAANLGPHSTAKLCWVRHNVVVCRDCYTCSKSPGRGVLMN